MAPGGTKLQRIDRFRRIRRNAHESYPAAAGSHEWLPYSKDEVRLKSSSTNLSLCCGDAIFAAYCAARSQNSPSKPVILRAHYKSREDSIMSVITITKDNFEQEVLASDKPVLLDFWASWCGPCRMVSPIVDEIAEEREDIKVGKVNVDEESELAARFRVMSIPTLVVMKDGEIVNQSVGARPKAQILAML
ncbi:MAG: thioredoxin [Candidatus Faecousia sp.]|nr:thioredoxin [Candidatus Faecousia sp.]